MEVEVRFTVTIPDVEEVPYAELEEYMCFHYLGGRLDKNNPLFDAGPPEIDPWTFHCEPVDS